MKTIKALLREPRSVLYLILLAAVIIFVVGTLVDNNTGTVITGQAVTPSIISTPNATDQATAERVTTVAAQATAERIRIEQTIDAIKSQMAAVSQVETGQATLAGTPVPATEWRDFSDNPPAWQVVEVVIVARYVYDPERDVWIALEDDPQWQAWRPAQQ